VVNITKDTNFTNEEQNLSYSFQIYSKSINEIAKIAAKLKKEGKKIIFGLPIVDPIEKHSLEFLLDTGWINKTNGKYNVFTKNDLLYSNKMTHSCSLDKLITPWLLLIAHFRGYCMLNRKQVLFRHHRRNKYRFDLLDNH